MSAELHFNNVPSIDDISHNPKLIKELFNNIDNVENDFSLINLSSDLESEQHNEKIDQLDQLSKISQDLEVDLGVFESERCKLCHSDSVKESNGLLVCEKCSSVNGNIIEYGQEWRYYGPNDNKTSDPTRCGMPTNSLLPNSSLGSVISTKYNESYKMRKIRNVHMWNSSDYQENSLIKSFTNISILAKNSGISSCIIEEAKFMYKEVSKCQITRGENKTATQAASVQLACKIKGYPRNSDEIAEIFKVSKRAMRKAAKSFEEIWNAINHNKICSEDNSIYPSLSTHYVHRFCSKLNMSEEIYQICKDVCEIVEEEGILSTHIPLSRAAGCIYLVCYICELDVTKQDIFKFCNVSEVTTNKCFQKLYKHYHELIPQYILDCLDN